MCCCERARHTRACSAHEFNFFAFSSSICAFMHVYYKNYDPVSKSLTWFAFAKKNS
jgi:hypothetical protein